MNLVKILAGKQKSQRPKSRLDPVANLATNLAEILAGFKQKSSGVILQQISSGFSPGGKNPESQNLAGILP